MKINKILEYFDELIENPHCELNYKTDYEFLIAVMLSAQTTDKRVNQVTKVLFDKYPTLNDLEQAKIEDIKEIIKPIGTYQKKALYVKIIAKELNKTEGKIPNDRNFLESLPGVGRKTTNLVLSEIYNMPYFAVDTHVSRVSKRLGLVKTNDDVLQIEKKLTKLIPKDRINKTHHQFILFGRYYCKAKNPDCNSCKLKDICKNYNKKL